MNQLVSNRLMLTFEGMMGGGILLTHLFSFLGLHNITGCLIGAGVGYLVGYIIGRRIDLREEKN